MGVTPDYLLGEELFHKHKDEDLSDFTVLDSRYLKLDASNDPITGQLELNIATGTSPFLITSTTVNTNLNADLLDGLHDTAFLKVANNLSDLNNVATARTNLGLVAGGTGDIWVEKAGDTMTGDLLIKPSTDSITGFVVQDKDANGVLTVDTVNNSVGIGIAPTATSKLYVNRDSTESTGSIYAGLIRNTINLGANSNGTYYGLSFGLRDSTGSTYNITGSMRGIEGYVYKYGNSVLSTVTAIEAQTGILQAGATGSVATMRGMRLTALNTSVSGATIGSNIGIDIINDVAGTTTQYIGIQIADATASAATTKYGILLGNISGGTNNYGIYTGTGLNEFNDQLFVDGSADRVQLRVQGHSTQTTNLLTFENSSGTLVGGVTGLGNIGSGVSPSATQRILSKGSSSISAVTFTGTGLNDLVTAGTYLGGSTTNITYTVVIDAVGTPDTFKWKAGGMDYITGVAITGGVQALRDGASIDFGATTGHTLNDQWTFTVVAVPVFAGQDTATTTLRSYIGANGNMGIGQGVNDGIRLAVNYDAFSPYYDPATTYYYAMSASVNVNPSANAVSGWRTYGAFYNVTKYGNFSAGQVIGARFNGAIAGGTCSFMTGGGFIVQQTGVSSTATTVNAGEFEIQKYTAGTTFTATTAHLMRGAYSTVAGTWAITTAHGLYLSDISIATNNYAIVTNAGNVIHNEGGDPNTDFRVESDTEVNMVFVDSNADTDGAVYLGGSTNGIKINKGGNLTLLGTATVFDDLMPNAVSVGTGGGVPAFTAYNGNLKAYEFVGAALTKEIHAEFQLPHAYKEGSNIEPHIHLYVPNDATGGVIKFGCEYTWVNIDGTEGATATITGTVTIAAGAGNLHKMISFGSITGTGKTISSILSCRIYRDPADAADTFGASVWMKAADVHHERDKIGSFT